MRTRGSSRALKLLPAALLCALIMAADARAGIVTGLGGLTKTSVGGTSAGSFSSNGPGWLVGGLVDFTLSIATGFETGLFFGRRKLTRSSPDASGVTQTLDVGATYVELPVEYLWRMSRLFFLGTGIYYLHYLSADYKAYVATDPTSVVSSSFTIPSDDFGLLVSVGGEFPIAKQTAIRAEVRYNYGLISSNRGQEGAALLGLSYRF